MDTKYIIGAVIAIILVLIGGALLMGGGTHERGPGEIVVAAYSHGGEPEAGFDPIAGWNYYAEPLIQLTVLTQKIWLQTMILILILVSIL